MIPVYLKIKGIYSYKNEQEIHFNPLLAGQIFGIFGSVGSGKSTIIEAISFVLFNKTERLDAHGLNYNMMNLKSKEMLIDFIFKSFDGAEYRFTHSAVRDKKHFQKVKTPKRAAYKRTDGEWVPLEETGTAEEILGMSYESFRRTIIIQQGQFQEFLQLGKKDRSNMLKEIFNLRKFEFFHQTRNLETKNDRELENLKGQLIQYEGLTEEKVKEYESELKSIEKELNDLKKQCGEKEKEEKELAELWKQFAQLEKQQKELDVLKQKEEDVRITEKKIRDYETCLNTFNAPLKRRRELEETLNKKKQDHAKKQEELKSLQALMQNLQSSLQQLKQEYEKQDQRKKEYQDYSHLISILDLDGKITELNGRIANGEKMVLEVAEKKDVLKKEEAGIKARIKKLKQEEPDLAELSSVRAWFHEKKTIEEKRKELTTEINKIKNQLKVIPDKVKAALHEYDIKVVSHNPSKALKSLQEISAGLRREEQEIFTAIQDLTVQAKLGEFALELKEGRPCPLCGASEHPDVLTPKNVQNEKEHADKKLQEINRRKDLLDNSLLELNQIKAEEDSLKNSLDRHQEKKNAADEQQDKHIKSFSWDNFSPDNEEFVEELYKSAGLTKKEIKEEEDKLEAIQGELENTSKNYDRYKEGIDKFKTEAASKKEVQKNLIGQLAILQISDAENSDIAELKKKAISLKELIEKTESKYQEVQEEYQHKKTSEARLSAETEHTDELIQTLKSDHKKVIQELEDCLKTTSYADLSEVEAILQDKLDLDKMKSETERFRRDFSVLSKEVEKLQSQLEGKEFAPEYYDSLVKEMEVLKNRVEDSRQSFFNSKSRVEKGKEDLKNKQELESKMDKLQTRAENLKTLKNMFTGNKFVDYISSVHLQNLCTAANSRFYKLTNQQLRLEITEDNSFQVRDFLNNGRTRNIKTLSGGQTFQASLSLALALAESVQEQNKAEQNFFFLDEGFGSLDKNSLDIVFDTLKALRKENRIVGIISHVEELQQEIGSYIKVVNDEENGSRVSEIAKQ